MSTEFVNNTFYGDYRLKNNNNNNENKDQAIYSNTTYPLSNCSNSINN